MKTYVITAKTGFGVNGEKLEPGDEIAVLTSNVSPENLFCWLQFGQAEAVLVKDDESEELPIATPEEVGIEDEPASEDGDGPAANSDVTPEPQPDDSSEPDGDDSPVGQAEIEAAFVADGLDEKIANTLAEQNITPDEIRQMIAEGFDLEEIEGIGKVRAEKIAAIYGSTD